MKDNYKKGDIVSIQGEVELDWGVSSIGSLYDEEKDLLLEDFMLELKGRKIKVSIEFLD